MTNGIRPFWMGCTTFAVGALVGVAGGVLLTPQSGARTRRQLQGLAKDVGERAGEWVVDAKQAVKHTIDRGKKFAAQSVES